MRVRTVRRPAGQAGRQEAVEDSGTTVDAAEDGPALGDRVSYRCPFCDGSANATYKRDRDGFPRWFVGCWSLDCDGRHLPSLADALGLDPGADIDVIVAALRRIGHRSCRRSAVEPWSDDKQAGWMHRLLASEPDALRYLLQERGLMLDAIRAEQIGYVPTGTGTPPWPDLAAFVFPCRKKRFWPRVPTDAKGKPVKCVALPGSASSLDVKRPPGRALIVAEGELDAVLLRQHGLPTVTSTASTSWNPEWNVHVVGRRVAVIYDAGAESLALAERRAAEFAAAGAREAWAVDLGLERGEDVTDWFVTYGRTAEQLRALIRRARRAA